MENISFYERALHNSYGAFGAFLLYANDSSDPLYPLIGDLDLTQHICAFLD